MAEIAMRPDEAKITDIGNGDIKLSFQRDSGESREVILSRKWLPTLLARLARETEPGQMVPIDRGSLQIGATFSVQGYQVKRRPDGARQLVVAIELPEQNRVVTMPLEFSPKDVGQLIKMLS